MIVMLFCLCVSWMFDLRNCLEGAGVWKICAIYSLRYVVTLECIVLKINKKSLSRRITSVSFSTGKLIRQVVRNGLQCLVSVTKSHRWDFGWNLSHLVYLAGQYFTAGARSCLKRHCDWQHMCVHVWPLPSGSLRRTLCNNCQTSNTELCLEQANWPHL